MSLMRLDRLGATDEAATNPKPNDGENAINREATAVRRPQPEEGDFAADNINSRIQRVSGQAVSEIDRVISELTQVREMLKKESDRVQREISGYTTLSQASMTSMKHIADNLMQWRKPETRRT